MRNYPNIRNNYIEKNNLKPLLKQSLGEVSNTHWLSEIGYYHGVQHEKYVYEADGIGTKIISPHITNQTVISKKGTAILTISTGEIQIGAGWVTEIELSDGTLYRCEEQNGTIAYDASGNGNHGSLVGNITHVIKRDSTLVNYTNKKGYTKGLRIVENKDVVDTGITSSVNKIEFYIQTLSTKTQILISYNDTVNPDEKNILMLSNGNISYKKGIYYYEKGLAVNTGHLHKVIVDYVNNSISVTRYIGTTEYSFGYTSRGTEGVSINTYNNSILVGGGEDIAGGIFSSDDVVLIHPKFISGVTDIEYEGSDIAITNRTIAKYTDISNTQLIDSIGERDGEVFKGRCYNFDGVDDKITIVTANNSISEVSAIDKNGNIVSLTLTYITDKYEISTTGKVWNIKCWDFGYTPTSDEKTNISLESNLFAWFKCDETNGTTAFDSSGNENHGAITNATLGTFHAQDIGVTYSWLNEVGYSDGAGAYAGSLIPRNEAIPTQDVLGNTLQYQGRVKYNLDMIGSHCATFDGVDDHANLSASVVLDLSKSFTVRYHAKITNVSATLNMVLGNSSTFVPYLGFHESSSILFRTDANATYTVSGVGATLYSDNIFEYVKVGATMTVNVYSLAGALLKSASVTVPTTGTITLNRISGRVSDYRFAGSLSNLKIVQDGATILHLPMSEGKGLQLSDKSTSKNHATAVNTTDTAFWGQTQNVYHQNLVEGYSEGVNLHGRSEPSVGSHITQGGVTFRPSTAGLASHVANEVVFTDNSAIRYVYGNHHAIDSTANYYFSCYIEMDDGSVPVVGNRSASNDLAVIIDGGIALTSEVTITNIDGNVYELAFSSDRSFGTGNRNTGVLKHTSQSSKGFRASRFFLKEKSSNAVYVRTFGSVMLGVKIPAANATTDVLGNPLTNPAGNWHNGAETKLLAPQAPSLLRKFEQGSGLEYNTLFYDNTGTPIPCNPYDINDNYLGLNVIFSEELIPNQLDNIIVAPFGYSEYEEITDDLQGNNIILPIINQTNLDITGEPAQFQGEVASDMKLINSNCVNSDGISVEGIFNFDCAGLSITSKQGTADVIFDDTNDKIIIGSGTLYNLVLSNGYHFPIAEGLGTRSYRALDHEKYITWSNITWTTQDEYHYNINNGFTDDDAKLPLKGLVKVEDEPWTWITQGHYANWKNNWFLPSTNGTLLKGDAIDYAAVTVINVSSQSLTTDFSLKMMGKFANLTNLSCHTNELVNLDVTSNVKLISLYCHTNQLSSLDVSNNINLTILYCNNNQLTDLDVSNNINLINLILNNNQLVNLDVSNNINLTILYCNNNQLTDLDVSKLVNLTTLRCNNNQLSNIVNSQILIDLDENGKLNGFVRSSIFGGGTLTAAGLAAKDNLRAKGWNIL